MVSAGSAGGEVWGRHRASAGCFGLPITDLERGRGGDSSTGAWKNTELEGSKESQRIQ